MIITPSLIQEKNNDISLYSGLFEKSPALLKWAIFTTPYSGYTDLALWRVINFCKESLSVTSLWGWYDPEPIITSFLPLTVWYVLIIEPLRLFSATLKLLFEILLKFNLSTILMQNNLIIFLCLSRFTMLSRNTIGCQMIKNHVLNRRVTWQRFSWA